MDGDRDLLWMVRRLALCAGDPKIVQRSLCSRLGDDKGREAYLALRLTLYAICLFGRRRLRLAPPFAAETTRDEALILQLVAAAQHELDGLLEGSLLWLLDPGAPIDLRGPLRRLANLFSEGGLVLKTPDPGGSRPDAAAAAAARRAL